MLYKVTPMMVPEPKKAREPGVPRKRRKSAVYDADGHEVLISLMCLKCRSLKPLAQFGLRKMADGAIRNQPWCRTCRGGAGLPKGEKAPPAAKVVNGEVQLTAAEVQKIDAEAVSVAPPVDAPAEELVDEAHDAVDAAPQQQTVVQIGMPESAPASTP